MIVIARSYGQLGNRLFLYAHMIAAAEHYGVPLANPCFSEYAHLFPATASDLWCRYPRVAISGTTPSLRYRNVVAKSVNLFARSLHSLRLRKYPCEIVRLRGDESCDLNSQEFAQRLESNRHLLAMGWLFRSDVLFDDHAGKIRKHFRLHSHNQRNVDQAIHQARSSADVIIGVHIRHGDYAKFMNGKYYYSVEQYADVMRRIAGQLSGQRVTFLVCSNADLQPNSFQGLNIQLGPGNMIEDMYSFAQCDLIMGPPSTFSAWASFYGCVPLHVMNTAQDSPDISSLRRIAA